MSFVQPELLWSLLSLPLLVVAYLWLLRRRKLAMLRYPSLLIVKEAIGSWHSWQRQLPPALLMLAVGTLLLASARPVAKLMLPTQQKTIILAMDVSFSMSARDVLPNRLVAAQNAAKAFLAELPRDVKVGLVEFGGVAAVVQGPTLQRDEVVAAIDRLQLQRATAIGSAIALSVATIFPDAGIDPPRSLQLEEPQAEAPDEGPQKSAAVAPGSYPWAAVVLLTDGRRTVGPDPIAAARLAAERGLRVYTVGLGTAEGRDISFDGWTFRVRLDEATLREVAARTGAEYFNAGSADDLMAVYRRLSSRFVMERTETELTGLFSAFAALLIVVAAVLSVRWFG